MTGRLLTGIVLAGVVALVAWNWTRRDRFTPVEEGGPAPAYEAPSLDGEVVSLSGLRDRVVLLNVWATWCPPCIWEMPAMERLYGEYGPRGLEIVAVSVDAGTGRLDPDGRPGGDVRAFVKERDLTFTVLLDPEGRIQRTYGIFGLPTTYLIDRKGRIRHRVLGPAPWDEEPYAGWVRQLLEEQ